MAPVEWQELDSVGLGKKIRYRMGINAEDFKGRAGMPWLVMAANLHLSINELLEVMEAYGYYRTRSWVSRRRWIFFDPCDVRNAGGVRNADGQEKRAYQIMDEHPRASAHELARILRKNGIQRGKDWVLKNRVRLSAGVPYKKNTNTQPPIPPPPLASGAARGVVG